VQIANVKAAGALSPGSCDSALGRGHKAAPARQQVLPQLSPEGITFSLHDHAASERASSGAG